MTIVKAALNESYLNGVIGILELPMNDYEIRILDDSGNTKLTVHAAHVSDFAAVRSARKFAGGRIVEVWHELECIYAAPTNIFERKHHAA